MPAYEQDKKNDLKIHTDRNALSRRWFMRSLGLGSLGLGIQLAGFSQKENLLSEVSGISNLSNHPREIGALLWA